MEVTVCLTGAGPNASFSGWVRANLSTPELIGVGSWYWPDMYDPGALVLREWAPGRLPLLVDVSVLLCLENPRSKLAADSSGIWSWRPVLLP